MKINSEKNGVWEKLQPKYDAQLNSLQNNNNKWQSKYEPSEKSNDDWMGCWWAKMS